MIRKRVKMSFGVTLFWYRPPWQYTQRVNSVLNVSRRSLSRIQQRKGVVPAGPGVGRGTTITKRSEKCGWFECGRQKQIGCKSSWCYVYILSQHIFFLESSCPFCPCYYGCFYVYKYIFCFVYDCETTCSSSTSPWISHVRVTRGISAFFCVGKGKLCYVPLVIST